MDNALQQRIEKLRADHDKVRGRPFRYFQCPILFTDDEVELCKAHIINQAFPNSERAWTVQRKDVDNFYGSMFESDFVAMKYIDPQSNIAWNSVADKARRKAFKPSIQIDGEPIAYYDQNGEVPRDFTRIRFDDDSTSVDLVLKMPIDEVLEKSQQNWEVVVETDLRIPALVTMLKAAHLTLFELIGYGYAFSAAGRFVGHDILGSFYLNNKSNSKNIVVQNALLFFQKFTNMVLPIKLMPYDMKGTITDKKYLVCVSSNTLPRAWIIIVETGGSLNAVLIPVMDQPDAVARFLAFLRDTNETIECRLCQFDNTDWQMSADTIEIVCPK